MKPLTDYRWFKSHWMTFACLIPFLTMFAVHRALNLSDKMGARPVPGERDALLYNYIMVMVFYGGVSAYVWHTFAAASRKPEWVAFKLIVLVVSWTGLLLLRPWFEARN